MEQTIFCNSDVRADGGKQVIMMAGISAYARPIKMPLVAKKPLKRKMSKKAKEHFERLFSKDVELFEDEQSGELYAKITDNKTGCSEIRKCEYTDED